MRGIYIDYARRVREGAVTYYLVPAANVNQVRALPGRCFTEQLSVFRRDASGLVASRRTAAIRYETAQLRLRRAEARHPAGVCLFTVEPGVHGGGGCQDAPSLRDLANLRAIGGGNDHETVTAVIVPNRVATVTAHYRAQTHPGRVPRAIRVTHQAHGNVALFSLRGAFDPPTLTYHAPDGTALFTGG